MRLPWLTARRLMVVVALAGLAMGGIIGLWRRNESFRRATQLHAAAARQSAESLWDPRAGDDGQSLAALHWRVLAYHSRLMEKYERASRCPWLPVPPDPPPPELPPDDGR